MPSSSPSLEQLAAAMRATATTAAAERTWSAAAAMVDAHAQRVRQTAAAAVADHVAAVDMMLCPTGPLAEGEEVTLTATGVAALRDHIAAIVDTLAHLPADVIDPRATVPAPPAAAQPEPTPDIAPDLLRDMQRIAKGYRGLAYDPHDRPEEVDAVVAAARAAGLVPVPDESLMRTYRGCTPPTPPPAAADPTGAALAAEAAQYRWTAGGTGPVDDVLAMLATQARPLLDALYAATPNGSTR